MDVLKMTRGNSPLQIKDKIKRSISSVFLLICSDLESFGQLNGQTGQVSDQNTCGAGKGGREVGGAGAPGLEADLTNQHLMLNTELNASNP